MAPSHLRWIVLASDGRHSTIGRDTAPDGIHELRPAAILGLAVARRDAGAGRAADGAADISQGCHAAPVRHKRTNSLQCRSPSANK